MKTRFRQPKWLIFKWLIVVALALSGGTPGFAMPVDAGTDISGMHDVLQLGHVAGSPHAFQFDIDASCDDDVAHCGADILLSDLLHHAYGASLLQHVFAPYGNRSMESGSLTDPPPPKR